jgi:radical SAM protein with 4Fe4S-binding SPASM domain
MMPKDTLLSKLNTALKAFVTRRITFECDRIPYAFENVRYAKILNWLLTETSVYFKPARPWGLPTLLQVEPSAHCNLKCVACPVTEGMNRPSGHMDYGLFKKVIDEVGGYLFLLLLWDWGEPFLNPSIYDMISYAKQRGIKLVSSTNGHVFANGKHANQLVRSGLDALIVAVDGITQESYQRYRRDGSLELALNGIRNIVAQKRARGSDTPLINLRFVVMKHNEREIPALDPLSESLGVDMWSLKTLNPYSYDDNSCQGEAAQEDPGDLLPKNKRYRRFEYTEDGKRIRVSRNPCRSLWNCPSVHWSGRVCSCTFDYAERCVLGDLYTQAFEQIWYGAPAKRMRRQFRTDWERIGLCRDCSYAYVGGSCVLDTVRDASFVTHSEPP